MRFEPVTILSAGDMSTATLTSTGIDMNQIVLASIQAVYTGAPVGTLILEVSNDIIKINPTVANQSANVVTWTTYTGSSVSVSAAGDFVWNLTDIGYRWLRMKYTKTSGTGSLTAVFSGKGSPKLPPQRPVPGYPTGSARRHCRDG